MLDRSQCWRELAAFLLLTFGAVIMLGAAASSAGGLDAFPAAVLAMLTPGLAAILVQKVVARRALRGAHGLGLAIGRKVYLIFAPLLFASLVMLSLLLSFFASPDLAVSGAAFSANVSKLAGLPLLPDDVAIRLTTAIILTLVIGPLLNLPLFLGEELGWRGFMTPRLLLLFGKKGVLIAGAIWAVWHTPLIILGHNYPAHPVLGHLVWVPLCMFMSVLLQALYAAGRSILAPALAHGAMNQMSGLLLSLLVVETNYVDWAHGPAGLAGLLLFAIPAIWVYVRKPHLLQPFAGLEATSSVGAPVPDADRAARPAGEPEESLRSR